MASIHSDLESLCVVTNEEKVACLNKHKNATHHLANLYACGACGVRRCETLETSLGELIPISELPEAYSYTEAQNARLDGLSAVRLPMRDGSTRDVDLKAAQTYFDAEDGKRYHLYPNLVEIEVESGVPCVRLCRQCTLARSKAKPSAGKNSIANGVDFGRPEKLGLRPPTAAEHMLLANVNVYNLTVQIELDKKKRGAFIGHALSFYTDGEHRAKEALWKNPSELPKHLQVVLVGPKGGQEQALKERSKLLKPISVDPHYVLHVLILRKALNGDNFELPGGDVGACGDAQPRHAGARGQHENCERWRRPGGAQEG